MQPHQYTCMPRCIQGYSRHINDTGRSGPRSSILCSVRTATYPRNASSASVQAQLNCKSALRPKSGIVGPTDRTLQGGQHLTTLPSLQPANTNNCTCMGRSCGKSSFQVGGAGVTTGTIARRHSGPHQRTKAVLLCVLCTLLAMSAMAAAAHGPLHAARSVAAPVNTTSPTVDAREAPDGAPGSTPQPLALNDTSAFRQRHACVACMLFINCMVLWRKCVERL